jgi:hypothetical protein
MHTTTYSANMKIRLEEDLCGDVPPMCRWIATDAADPAPTSIGYGSTPEEAVADLLEIMEAEGELEGLDPDRLREDRDERLMLARED